MKTFTRLFTMLAVAAFVAAGCVNEEPPYKEEPKPTPGDATGPVGKRPFDAGGL